MDNSRLHYLLLSLMFIAISCNETIESEFEIEEPIGELAFDKAFDFKTSKTLLMGNLNRFT